MIEELAYELADSEAAIIANTEAMDKATAEIDKQIAELKEQRAGIVFPFTSAIDKETKLIEGIKERIMSEWDGTTKTIPTDFGILKFRTNSSLIIRDEAALLANLLQHFSTNAIVETYIKGFNKTALKKYMNVLPIIPDIAEIEYKTSVTLKVA